MRKAGYKNEIGQELIFDNAGVLFCENIDTEGIQGRPVTEQLAFMPGQRTIDRSVGARTVILDIAFCDRYDDKETMQTLCEIFSPLYSGTLTVWDEEGEEYSLTVTPAANVQPKRQEVPYVYRMSIDLVADDPFWRVGSLQEESLSLNNTGSGTSKTQDSKTISYYGTVKTSPYLAIAPVDAETKRAPVVCTVRGKGIYVYDESAPAKTIYIDCETLEVKDESGNDASTALDPSYEISELYLEPGANTVTATVTGSGAANISIGYYIRRQGVPKWL